MTAAHPPSDATTNASDPVNLELTAEYITVIIRWFGLAIGFILVNALGRETEQFALNAILAVGGVYAIIDTLWSVRGRVFLSEFRLGVSVMEAAFIGLLCYFDGGLDSPFRFYYFLSLVVCAMRHTPVITFTTFALHSLSYIALAAAMRIDSRPDWILLFLMLVFMAWVTWAITALTGLMKAAGRQLVTLNSELKQNQLLLEERIQERTHELQESQALLVQQEKQAAFGLLAAGIAHEVGNPLASISSLVQMLNRGDIDTHTRERLSLVDEQLLRIQRTLRELVDFSRPATREASLCDVHEIIDISLSIAKYYKRRKGRHIATEFDRDIPTMRLIRDQLVQVILNLILNALDATDEGGRIEISTRAENETVIIGISDSGHGIKPRDQSRLFRPYFTTKETGTGLGLFVCHRIMEESGGRIELAKSDGSGTTFLVVLPVSSVEAPEPTDSSSVQAQ